jgi:asparagine synthase (glutamine-hydrolysing)
MCGIIGSVSDRISKEKFFDSMKLMFKRGPDNNGISIFEVNEKKLFLGHQRLSIIDLSENGKQPFFSNDNKFSIVFNGEIYNYKELRQELKELGYQFRTDTDTEVLLNAWIEWKKDSLNKLIGMFSFAIFDSNNMQVTCVKDPFGIKPFYYYFNNNEFFFASEVLTLKKLIGIELGINEKTALNFLIKSKYDIGDDTFISNIFSLKPGSLITIKLDQKLGFSVENWHRPIISENKQISFDDAVETLRQLFLESVKLHLRSDVPLGVTLSGGLDSSAVACAIKYIEPDFPLNTFSYVACKAQISEEKWVDIVNAKTGAIQHKITFQDDEIINDLNDLIKAQGEPFCTASIYAQYRVFKKVKEDGITVTLDGQGGDEVLCGYDGYPREIFNSLIDSNKFIDAAKFIFRYNKFNNQHLSLPIEFAKSFLSDSIIQKGKSVFRKNVYPEWVNKEYILNDFLNNSQNLIFKKNEIKTRHLSASLASELTYSRIPRLLRYADRNSMNFSIESRVPFLNTKLTNFMLTMPEKFMVSENGISKNMFRYAMRGILPDEIIDRKDKIGFEAPEKDIVLKLHKLNKINFEILEKYKFLNVDKIRKYVNYNLENNKYNNVIWRLIIFSNWAQVCE